MPAGSGSQSSCLRHSAGCRNATSFISCSLPCHSISRPEWTLEKGSCWSHFQSWATPAPHGQVRAQHAPVGGVDHPRSSRLRTAHRPTSIVWATKASLHHCVCHGSRGRIGTCQCSCRAAWSLSLWHARLASAEHHRQSITPQAPAWQHLPRMQCSAQHPNAGTG